jgi:hypothetical protein
MLKKAVHDTRRPQARQHAPLPERDRREFERRGEQISYVEKSIRLKTKLEAFFSILSALCEQLLQGLDPRFHSFSGGAPNLSLPLKGALQRHGIQGIFLEAVGECTQIGQRQVP